MTIVADRLPPTNSKHCGTKNGWRSHIARKQNPCDECRKVSAKSHRKISKTVKFKRDRLTEKERWGAITITRVTP